MSVRLSVPWFLPSDLRRVSGKLSIVPVLLPLVIAACGIICSIVGTVFVRAGDDVDTTKIQHALDFGAFGAAAVMAAATFGIANVMWPAEGLKDGDTIVHWTQIGIATVIGLGIGVLVGMITLLLLNGQSLEHHR